MGYPYCRSLAFRLILTLLRLQILSVFVVIPPLMAVARHSPRFGRWIKSLPWMRYVTRSLGCERRRKRQKRPTLAPFPYNETPSFTSRPPGDIDHMELSLLDAPIQADRSLHVDSAVIHSQMHSTKRQSAESDCLSEACGPPEDADESMPLKHAMGP
jgi:hypothetical protein